MSQPPGPGQFGTPPPLPQHPHQPPHQHHAGHASAAPGHAYGGTYAAPPPPPVVQVVQRRSGFGRLVGGVMTALTMMGAIFALGMGTAFVGLMIVGAWLGGSGFEDPLLWHSYREGTSRTIAIIPVEGVIDSRKVGFVRACVDQVLESDVSAVILRVDSPGGGVTASDQIWAELERLDANSIPVVASFGGIAASGGYYVAMASDHIIAEETCITGSIGVIAQVLTMGDLMDKVGVEPVTLVATRSPRKNVANDTFRNWTEDDREQLITILDAAYDVFRARVETGRGDAFDSEDLSEVANGEIFTSAQALDLGLIDGIGYLDDAVVHAEGVAGITPGRANVLTLRRRPTFFETMAARRSALDFPDAGSVRTFINELSSVRLMYLMN